MRASVESIEASNGVLARVGQIDRHIVRHADVQLVATLEFAYTVAVARIGIGRVIADRQRLAVQDRQHERRIRARQVIVDPLKQPCDAQALDATAEL